MRRIHKYSESHYLVHRHKQRARRLSVTLFVGIIVTVNAIQQMLRRHIIDTLVDHKHQGPWSPIDYTRTCKVQLLQSLHLF